MGSLGDVSGGIVANVRVKSGHKHEGLVQEFANSFSVGFDSSNTVEVK